MINDYITYPIHQSTFKFRFSALIGAVVHLALASVTQHCESAKVMTACHRENKLPRAAAHPSASRFHSRSYSNFTSELKTWNNNSKCKTVALRPVSIIKEQINKVLLIGLERGTPSEWSVSSRCRRRAGLEGCDISRLWKVRRCLARACHRPPRLAPGFSAQIWHLMSRCEHVVQIHQLCLCIMLSKWEFLRP